MKTAQKSLKADYGLPPPKHRQLRLPDNRGKLPSNPHGKPPAKPRRKCTKSHQSNRKSETKLRKAIAFEHKLICYRFFYGTIETS